ncbi:MAG: protein-L-isoaspartate(D-aspartate) O-methyltransferase [Sphingomonas sp.]
MKSLATVVQGLSLSVLLLAIAGCAYPPAKAVTGGFIPMPRTFDARRAMMVGKVRTDILRRLPGFDDDVFEQVLAVMMKTPRERFLSRDAHDLAYLDFPLPIGFGQTISDPHIVAVMTAAVKLPPRAHVLDIGTGSGYQAAILSPLAASVVSIEIVPQLAAAARRRLGHMGYANVSVHTGDGFLGSSAEAPYDAIIVAAGAEKPPQPLIDQLKVGGRMVMPIGPTTAEEELVMMTKQAGGTLNRCSLGGASFVPLTGIGQRSTAARDRDTSAIPSCFGVGIS